MVVSLAVTELQGIHMTKKGQLLRGGIFGGKTPVVLLTSNMFALESLD